MTQHNRAPRQQHQHNPLTIHDPAGEYDFEVVLKADTGVDDNPNEHSNSRTQVSNCLLATKQCYSVSEAPGVDFTTPEVSALIDELLNVEIVDQEADSAVSDRSVKIAFVLEMDRTGCYHPTTVLLDGTHLSEYNISAGFWTLPSRLQQLICKQTRGLSHSQVPY